MATDASQKATGQSGVTYIGNLVAMIYGYMMVN